MFGVVCDYTALSVNREDRITVDLTLQACQAIPLNLAVCLTFRCLNLFSYHLFQLIRTDID